MINFDQKRRKFSLLKEKLFLALFLLMASLLFYFASYSPMEKKIRLMTVNADSLKGQVARDTALASDLKRHVKRLQEVSESYELEVARLASSRELTPLSIDATTTFREVTAPQPGISFLSIEPAGRRKEGPYTVLPVNLQLRGAFASLGKYLQRLEGSKSLIRVDQLDIARDAKPGLVATLKLNIFMLSEEEAG